MSQKGVHALHRFVVCQQDNISSEAIRDPKLERGTAVMVYQLLIMQSAFL